MTTQHGRGAVARGELAVSAEGKILGLRLRAAYSLGSEMLIKPITAEKVWRILQSAEPRTVTGERRSTTTLREETTGDG